MDTLLPAIKTDEVIKFFGSKQKVAEAVGTTHSAVSQWGEYVPDSRVFEFHYLMKTKEWKRSCQN
ncbi:Cro/CI family transcriptional regulator [Vibrio fluvialis]|uniref:Cro/CI family transcriptional regulator n=1 Tax=Vibrio fluvialis TaxID=676 RepID=UPI001558A8E1|nr:Cro/CI family transcriptional regulator [Vibrio fluvialis]MBY7960058.1 Cro/Cl family transcriptional regulator [Vibrio fluvialis]MCG6356991.1 Cro/CI family transcriptional regulator [Vibrio fluvialis]